LQKEAKEGEVSGVTRNIAAIDLGAESGRVMLARFDGERLHLEEVHRFTNRPVSLHGHLFWNMLALWDETLVGLRKARQLAGTLDSIGVDSWAVDYALIDRAGYPIGHPYHYRDHRTAGVMEQVFAQIPRETFYQRTGIQMLPINTIFQLYAHVQSQPELFMQAHRLLMIPDLLHNWLCGSDTGEHTNATTTQCWDPHTRSWATDVLDSLGIPATIFPPIVEAGTVLGPILPELRTDFGDVRVIAPATHDTGSAIAAVPVTHTKNWAYISSGTDWCRETAATDHGRGTDCELYQRGRSFWHHAFAEECNGSLALAGMSKSVVSTGISKKL
jgi:rhamnulokinase